MPFTFAHPAIILPFLKSRYFSATALIAGSMAPDFEYFLRMSVKGEHGHTLAGLIYFDVPVVFGLALIFHRFVKRPLIRNLPVSVQARLAGVIHLDLSSYLKRHYLIFLTSALLGAFSHILWDSFTHNNGFFAQRLSVYHGTYIPFLGTRYPLFFALQHISTVIGLSAIWIYVAFLKPQPTEKANNPSVYYWLSIMLITFVVTGIRFSIRSSDFMLGNFVVVTISGFCVALITTGLWQSKFPVRGPLNKF